MPYKDKEKNYACTRVWLEKNKEHIAKYQKKYQQSHKEDMHANNAKYRRTHPEAILKKNRKYYKNHPEVFKAKDARRRTAKTSAGGAYTSAQWVALCNKFHNRCLCCGKKRKLTADHVVPVSKGGSSNISNIQPLCGPCNSKKKDKVIDFRKATLI